jgi:hypothetical protein
MNRSESFVFPPTAASELELLGRDALTEPSAAKCQADKWCRVVAGSTPRPYRPHQTRQRISPLPPDHDDIFKCPFRKREMLAQSK